MVETLKANWTAGPWHYDSEHCAIFSETAVEPYMDFDGSGKPAPVPVKIVMLTGAMGGDNTCEDAQLMASAPELATALHNLAYAFSRPEWQSAIAAFEPELIEATRALKKAGAL